MTPASKVIAAAVLQGRLLLYAPANVVVTALLFPMMYSVIYLLILDFLSRDDLGLLGIIGPALIGVWATAVGITASVIDDERWNGSLELLAVLPGDGLALSLLGRTLTPSLFSLIAFAGTFVVARFGFGVAINTLEPFGTVAVLALTVLSATGVGMIVGALLVLSRSALQFQTTLTFPFYLLGGVAFPVSELPAFIQPLSYLVSLSWISDILFDLAGGHPTSPISWLMLTLLTTIYLMMGLLLVRVLTRRAQATGTMGYA